MKMTGYFELVLTVKGNNRIRDLRRGEVIVTDEPAFETQIFKLSGDRRRAWRDLRAACEESHRMRNNVVSGSLRSRSLTIT
jgi:hypothetical protein